MAAMHSSVALCSCLHGVLDFCAAASTDDVVEEVRQTEAEGGHCLRLEHWRSITVAVPSMPCVSCRTKFKVRMQREEEMPSQPWSN